MRFYAGFLLGVAAALTGEYLAYRNLTRRGFL